MHLGTDSESSHGHKKTLHDSQVIRFGVSADARLLESFDRIIKAKGYANRSEALRDLMRDQLVDAAWSDNDRIVVGTVTIVYDHEASELAQRLTDLQHHSHDQIISSLHVHLDERYCLEVLIIRGKGRDVKDLAEKLIGTKGVKHGKLAMSSTGQDLY